MGKIRKVTYGERVVEYDEDSPCLICGEPVVGEAKERCLKGAGAIGEEADFSSTIKWYGRENECVYVLSDGTKVNSDQYCGYIIRKFKEMME